MSRIADVERKTSETDVTIGLNIDGEGKAQVGSGNGFFDHMLNSLSRHGLLNLTLKCLGDIEIDFHHNRRGQLIQMKKRDVFRNF